MRFLQMRVHRKENDGEGAFISSIIRGWHGHGHIVLWLGWIGQLLVTRCSPSPAIVGSSLLGTSWGCLVIISHVSWYLSLSTHCLAKIRHYWCESRRMLFESPPGGGGAALEGVPWPCCCWLRPRISSFSLSTCNKMLNQYGENYKDMIYK